MEARESLRDLAISDSGFLFDPATGSTFSVNATGRSVLDLLKQGLEVEQIRDRLAELYETAEHHDLDRDVREFMMLLREQGILPRVGQAESA